MRAWRYLDDAGNDEVGILFAINKHNTKLCKVSSDIKRESVVAVARCA